MALIYNKTNWKDNDESTPLNARNLNNLEDGVEYIYKKWDDIISDATTGDHAAEMIDARNGPGQNNKTLGQRLNNFDSQIKDKTTKTETQLLQNQVNNLVLGAVGDGNNPEVISSRGEFELLPNRLDDFDIRTNSLINQRNIFGDKSIRTKSWGIANGDYEIIEGSNFSNAIKIVTTTNKPIIYKDVNIESGDYILSLECNNLNKNENLYATISVVGYPTEVSSGGTVLYTQPDFKVYDYILERGYQRKELKFSLNTTNYNHCRFMIECRTLNSTYSFTNLYSAIENSICNEFSYIDYKFKNINNEIYSIKNYLNSKLYGKTLYMDGDSITFGAGYSGGYGKILSDKYGSINTNNAVSGGTLATGTTYGDGNARHHISTSVVNSVDKQYDYMILSGGFNDYGNNVPIGTLSNSEFNFTNQVTTDNVIGALETMFRHILQNYPTTKLYFLITHKANRSTNQANAIGKTMQDYVNAIKSVCERYSIPIINIWENSRMITAYDNISNTYTSNSDRVHPNYEGYKEYYLAEIERVMCL